MVPAVSRKTDYILSISASSEALFRYQVVSKVLARELGGEARARAVGAVAARAHVTVNGSARSVSLRTLYRWLAAYQEQGFAGLEPGQRPCVEASAILSQKFLDFLQAEKKDDPRASVPELIRRARETKVIAPDAEVCRATVWRAVKRMGLPTRRRPAKNEGDMRRFAYPHRMMMILADGKHFRAGTNRARRVALFFIDDATRKGLHVAVGTSENNELFLRGLYELIRRVGLMSVIYLDNGAGFISDDTVAVVANLPGVHLVNGTAGYPEGHGKIERFNRTAQADSLRGLDQSADVDPDCRALELRLTHYLGQYNHRPHESLSGNTPSERWEADQRPLRFPTDDETLRNCFVVTEGRTVSKDHIIKYDNVLYEAPRGLGGARVEVHRKLLDDELFLIHDGRAIRLHPVDPVDNARQRRGRGLEPEAPSSADGVVRTAANIAFDRDFGPCVDQQGGFLPPNKEK